MTLTLSREQIRGCAMSGRLVTIGDVWDIAHYINDNLDAQGCEGWQVDGVTLDEDAVAACDCPSEIVALLETLSDDRASEEAQHVLKEIRAWESLWASFNLEK
jgi:hypothetical protein